MRFLSYRWKGTRSFGVALDGHLILDLPSALREAAGHAPSTLDEALKSWDPFLETVRTALDVFEERPEAVNPSFLVPPDGLKIDAPLRHPSKIVAVGLNYMDHCREQKVEAPAIPLLFTKFPSAIIGPGDTIRWNERISSQVDFEAELGVVIGRRARRVPAGRALDFVAGYTALNDVSARDVQFGDKQWVRGKSFDTFCPMGPALVTADEIPDPHRLAIRCFVNGRAYQDSSTAEMIFNVPRLIEFITQGITLEPGDVIATGTPDGVGVFRKPPLFLRDGDEVIVSIEKIGELTNRVETSDEELWSTQAK